MSIFSAFAPSRSAPSGSGTIYEVMLCVGGRWFVDTVVQGDRAAALAHAQRRWEEGKAEEIKVVRERNGSDGEATQLEIFHQARMNQGGGEQPLQVTGSAEGAPLCSSAADLRSLQSRMIICRLMRLFMERFGCTATEMLYEFSWMKRLQNTGNIYNTLIGVVARAQSTAVGGSMPTRIKQLEGLGQQIFQEAQEIQRQITKFPAFEDNNIGGTLERVQAAFPPEQQTQVFVSLLSRHLMSSGSVMGRSETVMELMDRYQNPVTDAVFEGIIADALCMGDIIKELLGAHPNLASAMSHLADLVTGKFRPEVAKPGLRYSPYLIRVNKLLRTGRTPSAITVLTDRLSSELARNVPLDRRDPDAELRLIEEMNKKLKDSFTGQWIGGKRTEDAMQERLRRRRGY